MTDDTQWTDWIEHKAGDPCPIPDAKGGQFGYIAENMPHRPNHRLTVESATMPAVNYKWEHITHYRLRKPPVDWKAIADELAETLNGFASYGCPVCGGDCASANPPMNCVTQDANRALTRYREAIK